MPDPTPAQLSAAHDEVTRRLVVKLVFLQFGVSVGVILYALIFRGWELSPVAMSLITLILTTEGTAMIAAPSFYFGYQMGMKAAQSPDQLHVTAPVGATTTTVMQTAKPAEEKAPE